jgi:AcrR family transcriptional regulator
VNKASNGVRSAEWAAGERPQRRQRVDAKRNLDALLQAAKTVLATSGVDAPAKEITDLAGVGVGTLYRHFPQRSDLVKAVLEPEIDACAEAGPALSAEHKPGDALEKWLLRYTEFLATKHGLASALHAGGPSFDALRDYFLVRLGPTLTALLHAATVSGEMRSDVGSKALLYAVAKLCVPVEGEGVQDSQRMVVLLVHGLRYGANG